MRDYLQGRPPWWALPVPARERDVWLEVQDRAWWVAMWWRVIEGPFWRVLIACGVWETGEGGYFRRGRPTWANRYVRRVPDFPRDGREFWSYVWRGDLPSDLRYATGEQRR